MEAKLVALKPRTVSMRKLKSLRYQRYSNPCRPVRVLLGVSGSVATIKLQELMTKLREIPTEVKIVSTDAARHFFKDDWNLDIPVLGERPPLQIADKLD